MHLPIPLAGFTRAEETTFYGLVCGLLFGAPLAIVVLVWIRTWMERRRPTLARSWTMGLVVGGISAIFSVNFVFAAV